MLDPPRHPSLTVRDKGSDQNANGSSTTSILSPPRHPSSKIIGTSALPGPSTSQSIREINHATTEAPPFEQSTTGISSKAETTPEPTTVEGELDEKTLRKIIEDEEIQRYLTDFGKHVHHLRVPTKAPLRPLPKPSISKYTFSNLSARKMKPIDEGEPEDTQSGSSIKSVGTGDKWGLTDVDWLAYSSAYLRYLTGPTEPLPPLEPFTIARLRSNAERLYVVARPAWEGFGQTIGDICLWKNKFHTACVIIVYLFLVFTATLLPALCLLPLYPLLKRRFFPPSPMVQYQATLQAQKRSEEAAELVDEITTDPSQNIDEAVIGPGQGIGVGIDLRQASRQLGMERAGLLLEEIRGSRKDDQAAVGESASGSEENKGKSAGRKKLRARITEFEEEYGAGLVVVLGDLADLHEKVKNLYLWRSPTTSRTFIFILLSMAAVTYTTPLWIQVKIVQLALGVVAFVVVPVIAAQERYEPMSWMAGGAPTDAEYAIQLIKARAASGELSSSLIEQSPISPTSPISAVSSTTSLPLSLRTGLNRTITTTSSTTHLSAPEQVDKKKGVDWGKVIALGGKGAKIIETSRQVLAGEREIQLSMNGNDAINKSSSTSVTSNSIRLGKNGPGLALKPQAGTISEDTPTTVYFAQYGRTPGNLSISADKITFKPLFKSTKPSTQTAASNTSAVTVSEDTPTPLIAHEDGEMTVNSPQVRAFEVSMKDIVGIQKRDKTSMLVVVAAGLQIECIDGRTISLALVSNRDLAFQQIVSLCPSMMAKV